MAWFDIATLALHFGLLSVLCLFGLHRLSIVIRWFFHRHHQVEIDQEFTDLPQITVQIPIYNEQYVAQRIIDAVAVLNYPADKLQLQIVDDSTDNTRDVIAQRIAYHNQRGIPMEHVLRSDRTGFKAGALKKAMENSSGEFIAIFDADFIPEPDILIKTIHHFTNEKVGMLQFRWEHLNRDNNQLTELQSVMLDAHFGLEQHVRAASNLFLNFNGTAGIWRKETIYDAGNWSADTLTEDLDLSYRAQLKGWKMQYVNQVTCPAEVPSDMNAFKSQQHRWAKGGTEVMLKMLGTIWRSPSSIKHKIESTFHLSNNLAYLVLLIDTIFLLIPSILIREHYQIEYIWWLDLPFLIASSCGHIIYLVFGQYALGRPMKKAFLNIPGLLLLGIQISFNNARAGIEALLGHKTEFVRTPKSGELNLIDDKKKIKAIPRYKAVAPRGAMIEFTLSGVFFAMLVWCIDKEIWFMLPFMVFLIFGYASTSISSFINYRRLKN
jgi:cellulose synthase/poly-beta-1,6-N-acetylglucosamine synthase-like glycosyltransferase